MGPTSRIRYRGLEIEVWDGVYEPADDSQLLLEAALKAVQMKPVTRALEIGTGCGLTAIALSRAGCPLVIATDVSLNAMRCARHNAGRLAPSLHLVLSDMFSAVKGSFDLVLFNPPYLPMDARGPEDTVWAGGGDGRQLIDRFIMGLGPHLAGSGSGLMVQSSLNDLDLTRALAHKLGLRLRMVGEESFFFERLYVVELTR